MRIVSSQIKRKATDMLKGNRLAGAVMVGVIMAASLAQSLLSQLLMTLLNIELDTPSMQLFLNLHSIRDIDYLLLQVVAAAAGFFVTGPLALGFTRAVTRLCLGKRLQVIDLFYYYRPDRYLRALGYLFRLQVRVYGWLALAMLPALALQICAEAIDLFVTGAEWMILAEMMYGAAGLLLIGGAVLFLFLALRYFLSDYCYVLDGCATPRDCFAYSRALMKGHGGEIAALYLSFAGWYALCLLIFPLLYVQPYFATAQAFAAVQLIGEDRRLSAELAEPQQ